MKKIFRFLAVTALCGASLVYVGCTKDYSKEISDVKKDLTALQEGTIATHTQQIAALQQADKDLKAVDEALRQSIGTVQSNLDAAKADLQAKINAKADQTTVTALETRVKTLETNLTALTSRVAVVEDAIKTINTTLATKADKSWVEQTFATKAALKEVSDALGALTTRVDTAEKDIKDLQAADTRIEKEYKEADTKLAGDIAKVKEVADKAAEDIIKINGEIERLWANFDNYYQKAKVEELINKAKEELQEKIDAEKQARETADAKNLDSLEKVRVKLQNQIGVLNNEVIPALQQKDNELKAAIDTVEKHLNNEIVARIAKDAALKGSIDSVARCYRDADKVLQDQIDVLKSRMNAVSDSVKQEIADRIQAISDAKDEINGKIGDLSQLATTDKSNIVAALNEEIANRVNAISGLQTQIDGINTEIGNIKTKLAKLDEKVDDLAGRVNSISVCPTLSEEIMWVKAGKDSVKVIGATFEVSPASAAEYFTVDNTVINVAEARPRVKGGDVEFESFVPDTITVDKNTGRIEVIAHGLKKLSDDNNAYFFSCTFQAEDTAGVYNVTSDYALAVEKSTTLNITDNFKFNDGDKFSIVGNNMFYADKYYNYIEAKDSTHTPFKNVEFVFDNRDGKYPFLAKKVFPADSINKKTGLPLGFAFSIPAPEYPLKPSISSNSVKAITVSFKPEDGKSLSDYVSANGYYQYAKVQINGAFSKHILAQKYYITRVVHPTVYVDTLNLHWNYKTWKPEDRKDSRTQSQLEAKYPDWKTAIEHNAVALHEVNGDRSDSIKFVFGDWVSNDYKSISVQGQKLDNTKNYTDTVIIKKQSVSDEFDFVATIDIDSLMAAQVADTTMTIDGSVTLDREIVITNFAKKFICNADGTVKPELVRGLEDADKTFDKVYAAACAAGAYSEILSYSIDDAVAPGTYPTPVWYTGSDNLKITIPAGKFLYSENHKIVVKVKYFGTLYTYTVNLTTSAPKFNLKKNPMYINAQDTALVRGVFINKWYVINQMYHSHYLSLEGDRSDETAEFKVKFTTTTPAGAEGNFDGQKESLVTGFQLDPTTKFSWSTVTSNYENITAVLYVGTVPCDTAKFVIKTPVPLKFGENAAIVKNRTAAQDLPINLWENLEVFGLYDNQGEAWTDNLIDAATGEFVDTYKYRANKNTGDSKVKCSVEYDVPAEITCTDGTVLYEGQDYTYADGVLTICKESAIGTTFTFNIEAYVEYFCDWSHSRPITTTIPVTVQQN